MSKYVINSLLRRAHVATVDGPPKMGKSCMMLQLALAVATGTPFLRWNTTQGKVLIVDGQRNDTAERLALMGYTSADIDVIITRGEVLTEDLIYRAIPANRYALVIFDELQRGLLRDVTRFAALKGSAVVAVYDGGYISEDVAITLSPRVAMTVVGRTLPPLDIINLTFTFPVWSER